MRNLWEVLLLLVYMQGNSRRTQSRGPAAGASQGNSVADNNRQPHILRYRRTHVLGVLLVPESPMPEVHQCL